MGRCCNNQFTGKSEKTFVHCISGISYWIEGSQRQMYRHLMSFRPVTAEFARLYSLRMTSVFDQYWVCFTTIRYLVALLGRAGYTLGSVTHFLVIRVIAYTNTVQQSSTGSPDRVTSTWCTAVKIVNFLARRTRTFLCSISNQIIHLIIVSIAVTK